MCYIINNNNGLIYLWNDSIFLRKVCFLFYNFRHFVICKLFFLENDDIKVTKWGIGDNDDNVEKEECMVLDMVWFREEKFIALQLNSQWYRINIIFVLSILTCTKKRKCNVCLSGSGLFCVAYWSLVTLILLRVSGFHFCGWVIFHCVFIYYIFLKEDYTILIWVLFFFVNFVPGAFHSSQLYLEYAKSIGRAWPFLSSFVLSHVLPPTLTKETRI